MGKNDSDNFALSHQLLVIDANLVAPLSEPHQKEITENFVYELLGALGMEELGPLEVYPAVDDRAPGWSFIQPITTSHVSGHYFAAPGDHPHIHLDIYSCDGFDWEEVIAVADKHFGFRDWGGNFVERKTDGNQRQITTLIGDGPKIVERIELRR